MKKDYIKLQLGQDTLYIYIYIKCIDIILQKNVLLGCLLFRIQPQNILIKERREVTSKEQRITNKRMKACNSQLYCTSPIGTLINQKKLSRYGKTNANPPLALNFKPFFGVQIQVSF